MAFESGVICARPKSIACALIERVRTHESRQRRQLIVGNENFLAAPELLQSYNMFAGKSNCNKLQ